MPRVGATGLPAGDARTGHERTTTSADERLALCGSPAAVKDCQHRSARHRLQREVGPHSTSCALRGHTPPAMILEPDHPLIGIPGRLAVKELLAVMRRESVLPRRRF